MTPRPTRLFALIVAAAALTTLLPACSDGAQAQTPVPLATAAARETSFHSQYPAPEAEVQALPAQF